MKLLVYSDLQAAEGSERCFHNPSIPLQRWRVQKFYRWLDETFSARKCDGLVDAGDTVDDRGSIPHPVIDTVLAGLEPFEQHRKRNIKLIGNHDQWLRSGTVNVGRMFSATFQVCDGVMLTQLGGCNVVTASYLPDEALLREKILEKIGEARHLNDLPVVFLGHVQVRGCRMNSEMSVTGVQDDVLRAADLSLLGHVHGFQHLGGKAWYVGSPFQQDFGEAGDKKYVALLDLSSLTVEFIEVPNFPRYRIVNLDELERAFNPESEDRYKVILTSQDEAERFYALSYAVRVLPEYNFLSITQVDSVDARGSPIAPRTIKDIVWQYVKRTPPSGFNMDEAELVETVLEAAGVV